ncbi:unnamed protein product [Enterobius vermicularis]|uniref:Dirigent protein n=1 Tax=Enterobius vermicularis TaxID=51028 RepID=A0A0N4UZZ4_ENTVE|nr:unnamed protein product [Enterobius vermicularis]
MVVMTVVMDIAVSGSAGEGNIFFTGRLKVLAFYSEDLVKGGIPVKLTGNYLVGTESRSLGCDLSAKYACFKVL